MTESMSLPPYPDDEASCLKCGAIHISNYICDAIDAVTEAYCRGGKRKRYWLVGPVVNECKEDITGEHIHFECAHCGASYCTRTLDSSKPRHDERLERAERVRDEAIGLLRGLVTRDDGSTWDCPACNNLICDGDGHAAGCRLLQLAGWTI